MSWAPTLNGFWDPEDDINYHEDYLFEGISDPYTAPVASGQPNNPTPPIPPIPYQNTFVPDLRICDNASVPREGVSREQIQDWYNQLSGSTDLNAELQYLPNNNDPAPRPQEAEEVEEPEPEYVPQSSRGQLRKGVTKPVGPNPSEWEQRRTEIYDLYIQKNWKLTDVVEEMSIRGFKATKPMYNRKFKIWPGFRKNKKHERVKNHATPGREQSILRPSSSNTISFNAMRFKPRIPAFINPSSIDGHLNSLLFNVKNLFIRSMAQRRWSVFKHNVVEENEHDDLLVDVANALRNYTSLGPEMGIKGMDEAFKSVEEVVADCGLFSLPAIWVSYLRMIRQGHQQFAKDFVLLALRHAKGQFGYDRKVQNHPFVEALVDLSNIDEIAGINPAQLSHVIFQAYRSFIDRAREQIGAGSLTTLCLWGDYVVYLDGSSVNETQAAVDNIRLGIKHAEQEHGKDGDFTLKLLGLTLYILQSNRTMADEAEKAAQDMFLRVDARRKKAGGVLEGELRITWKDLHQTLGTFRKNRKDYVGAIRYLEGFLETGVEDGRDDLALQRLEECYEAIGDQATAGLIREQRKNGYQKLLRKDSPDQSESSATEGPQDMDETTGICACIDDDGESSEGTIVGDANQGREEIVEDEGIDALDTEAEIQIVKEQMALVERKRNEEMSLLELKLHELEKRRKKQGKKT